MGCNYSSLPLILTSATQVPIWCCSSCIPQTCNNSFHGIMKGGLGARFTNDFLSVIQIRWKKSHCSKSTIAHMTAAILCPFHFCTIALPCAKLCSDHSVRIEMVAKGNFHRVWMPWNKCLRNGSVFQDPYKRYKYQGCIFPFLARGVYWCLFHQINGMAFNLSELILQYSGQTSLPLIYIGAI